MHTSHKKATKASTASLQKDACDFISAGVACYAFSLLDELGLLDVLQEKEGLSINSLEPFPNPLIISSALQTLECNQIILLDKGRYRLTEFGKRLAKNKGLIGFINKGYSRVIVNQLEIAKDEPSQRWDLVDQHAISKAAADLASNFFNDLLLQKILGFSIKGSIGDLGCGNGNNLIYLCKKTGLSGVGFDSSSSSIKAGKDKLKEAGTG